jgi:predicted nucleotidyltransferase
MHDPSFSDIDLIVYGFSNAVRVRSFLQNQKNSERLLLRSLFGEAKEKWIAERLLSSCLTRENATDLLSRKWNIGLFGETVFSIHSVKTEDEVRERYGEERYTPLGVVDATTRVRNSNDSIFMPAIYEVEPKTLGTRPSYVIDRVVSFEGLYSDVVRQGEEMLCRGKLERVESSRGV